MITRANSIVAYNAWRGAPHVWLLSRLCALKTYVAGWMRTCADYGDAAALYERLSNSSDAELRRHGFSRATLARDLRRACDMESPN